MANKISECFTINFTCLRVFGIPWPGAPLSRLYKYYSGLYLFLTLILYNFLLTLNLFYTPLNIELMIREVLFYFAEASATVKAVMVIWKRDSLVKAFRMLDSQNFRGEGDRSEHIVTKYLSKYKNYWIFIALMSTASYFLKINLPIFMHFVFNTNIELPFYNYYFLDKETVDRYFVMLWIYQCVGIFGHMMYNVNVDTLIAGLMLHAIAQVKVIDSELRNLKRRNCHPDENLKLDKCLRHYDMLLNYVSVVQDITSVTMFIQFSVASGSICAILCSLFMPKSIRDLISVLLYMSAYAFVMLLQIFVPAYFGTQLRYSSQALVSAAYSSEWISRSESFKRSLKLFMLRANTAIFLTGCGLFPLTLDSFTSIMKTAYSFFTFMRNFQESDN